MSRRDMIILAVLLNAAILSFLFLTATRPEEELAYHGHGDQIIALDDTDFEEEESSSELFSLNTEPRDEVDHILKPYLSGQEIPLQSPALTEVKKETSPLELNKNQYTEFTVKRGDVLEKIARSHQVSVKELKRVNALTDDRLSIGQVLLVPKGSTEPAKEAKQEIAAQYYVVKPGDNPWKIARQNKVKLEELLELNGLTEESARNLKVGDKIRVQ